MPVSQLRRLALHGRQLQVLFELAGAGAFRHPTEAPKLASVCGISTARMADFRLALRACGETGALASDDGDRWRVLLPKEDCEVLALMLKGVNTYRHQVHQDDDEVSVVLSRPANPSQLVAALERSLQGFWGLSDTADALLDIARNAKTRLTIMSPFIDEEGARRIADLFDAAAPSAQCDLIVRDVDDSALDSVLPELTRRRVRFFSFRIPRVDGPGTETFHAKVVVRDGEECFVGSPNMTRWSFQYSLEMGLRVRGSAALRISQVLDAVMSVSGEDTR